MSANNTCARSRDKAWIVRVQPLAKKVSGDCLECRRRFKILMSQREAPIPEERMFLGSPPFTSTVMDFLGPYKVKAMTNSRLTMKVWPVVFGCLNTGAVHIKLNKTYGTNAFLLSIRAFTSIRGYPTVFYTDRGTQLCKAGK